MKKKFEYFENEMVRNMLGPKGRNWRLDTI
jgi:hypothetical protein